MSKRIWLVMMLLVNGFLGCGNSRMGSNVDGGDTANERDTDTINTDSNTEPETGSEFPDCPGAMPIRCGDRLSGTTANGRPSLWGAYNCTAQGFSGPESIYIFAPDDNCEVEARLTDRFVDLRLFLFPDCDSTSPLGSAIECAYDILTFTAVAGVPNYIVVDGLEGAEGAYTLALHCTAE